MTNPDNWLFAITLSALHIILLTYYLTGNLCVFTRFEGLRILLPCLLLDIFIHVPNYTMFSLAYLTLAAQLTLFSLAACLLRSCPLCESLFLGLAYTLIINSIISVFRLLEQKWLGTDFLVTGSVICRLTATAGLALCSFGGVFLLRKQIFPRLPLLVNKELVMLSFAAAIPYLYVFDLTLWLPLEREQVPASIAVFQFASCALALFIMISVERREQDAAERRQTDRLKFAMENQHQQYQHELERAELINRKYHDMKNMLLYLKECTNDEMQQHINTLFQEIRPYECSIHTGSQVIDILLTNKLAHCEQHQIICTPYVDGILLDFLPPLELSTIFGNALDNAIEGCLTVDDPAERFIHIKTAKEKGFIILNFRNSCKMRDKTSSEHLPTTKSDQENHGYGLPNMRQVAEKNGGQMHWQIENGEFRLTFLFPSTV